MFKFLKSLFGSNNSESNNAHTRLNVTEFKTGIANKNCLLVDVRTPNECSAGTIKNAKIMNIMSGDFQTKLSKLNIEKPLYLYCRSGMRSQKAAKAAVKLGFTKVYDLKGGYNAWN